MSSFGAKGLTNKGRVLQAKAQAGAQLKYTKYVIGDGQLGGQSIATLVNVISPKKTVEVSRLKMTPPNQAMVGFVLSNQDVSTGFYFRELGLYALDPDEGEILYWYANAGDTADYIPPTNTGDVVNKTIDMLVYVGTASNVTLTIDQNLAYVTHDELDEALAGLDPDIPDASLTEKGKVQLSSATNSTSEELAATPKAVKAAYDRADAAFTSASEGKGKVRDAITGVKGTVADADGDGIPTYDELVTGVKSIPTGFTADATAAAGDIRSGKTAYRGGAKVTGTLVTQATSTQTITPGTSNIVKPAGIYDGAITILGDADLVAGNFPKDVNLFGIQGTLERLTTTDRNAIIAAIVAKGVAASSSDSNAVLAQKIGQIITGKRFASGTITAGTGPAYIPDQSGTSVQTPYVSFDFGNIPFVPSTIEFTSSERDNMRITVWRRSDYYYLTSNEHANVHGGNGSSAWRVPYSNGVVSIPATSYNGSYDWIAYE